MVVEGGSVGGGVNNLLWDHDHQMEPWEFTLIPNEDGWVKFQDATTSEHLCLGDEMDPDSHRVTLGTGAPLWFRHINDSTPWAGGSRTVSHTRDTQCHPTRRC